ncbi:hypothetical protein B0I35DRAFT_514097 [Stachybotrys elegans]|uniref:Uncharacterized protein n=1 Tax=Stachybotrys elegans TaxID=80388 RepID=A0A8K0SQC5_9HYPO|nr:hypothetical protein B0I35DRAFT_514097 [Stachybotrys elegans]
MKLLPFSLAFGAGVLAQECTTSTTVMLGIDTTISNLEEWQSSMDAEYSSLASVVGVETVFVHTSIYTFPGGSFTGYQTYNSEALLSAGYNIVTQTATITMCAETSATDELPPAPTTGINCEPHGDHWHCNPLTTSGTETRECEPHGDHWHCPPGVPEPTAPPPETTTEPTALMSTTGIDGAATSTSDPPSSAVGSKASRVSFFIMLSFVLTAFM